MQVRGRRSLTFDSDGEAVGYRKLSLDGDQDPDTHWHGQNIDARNRIESVDFNDGSGTTNTARVFDAAGNLRADADYLYEYDAFNRLVQVRARGSLTFDSDGEPTGGAAGNWLAHFTYDGLGRLIRKQAPHPSPGGSNTHTERFYFDGVRRVLEVFTDPIPATPGPGIGIGPELGNPPPPRERIWGACTRGLVATATCAPWQQSRAAPRRRSPGASRSLSPGVRRVRDG